MSEQRYTRLQGLRVGVSVKQSDYVYVPDNILLVKKIENIGDDFEDLLQYLYEKRYELEAGRIYLWSELDRDTHTIIVHTDRRNALVVSAEGKVYDVMMSDGPGVYWEFQHVQDIGECDDNEDFVNKSGGATEHIVRGEIDNKSVIRIGNYFLGGDFGLGILDGNSIGRVNDVIVADIDELEIEIAKIKDGRTIVSKAMGDEYGNRISTIYATQNTLDDVINQKGQAGGYAPLDENTKLPLLYLYDSVLGQLEYVGTFDGKNIPTKTQNVSPQRDVRKGDYFLAIGSGVINDIDFEQGDWLIFDSPSLWQKIDNTDAVKMVNNKKGNVKLTADDIFIEDISHHYHSQKVDEAIEDLHQTKAEKNEVYTKEEVNNLLENYETSANSSKIYYNETKPSEWTKNDLWFHLIGE